ncbi:MAG: VOC family protein [Patescibacteria group bacterium]|jgi:predicted enzyme related to lactoylglutathione lyase
MKLRYIIIKVKDIQRAKKFYSRLLNMEPTKEERDRMVVFDLQNIKIGLYNPLADGYSLSESDFGNNYYASFGVDDVELELRRVSDFAEIICHKKVDYHDWFEFKDSEGNLLEVHKI